jgi:putative copper export protein
MLVLAAVNRLKLVPLAASNYTPAAMLLWWSILVELALGLVILLVVGALGVTPLSADE